MRLAALRRHGLPVLAALPVLVVGLVVPGALLPGGGPGDTVIAVPRNGPLGAGGADVDDVPLDVERPVTGSGGALEVRSAVARPKRPEPVLLDTAVPARVLAAYRAAARSLGATDPGCNLSWSLLAGIGKVESGHAYGGAVDPRGDTLIPILGPVLDGGPGVAAIPDTDGGRFDTDRVWDRAVGPMQFIPTSWALLGADGNGDGRRDPNNIADATLAAGGYLCSGDRDLRNESDRRAAVFSYNHSEEYVDLVLAWADAYESGVDVLSGTLLAALLGDRDGDGRRDRRRDNDSSDAAALGGVSGRVGLPTGVTWPVPVTGSPSGDASSSSVTGFPTASPTSEPSSSGEVWSLPSPDPSSADPTADPTGDPTSSSTEPSVTSDPVAAASPSDSPFPSPTSDPPTSSPTPSETDPAPSPSPSPDPSCPTPSPTLTPEPTPTSTATHDPSPTGDPTGSPDPTTSPSPSPTSPDGC